MPKVSVVIPCYNQGRYLAESIGSVLASQYDDLEIVVVDDGSTEPDSCRVLEEMQYPKTRLIRQHNQGLSAARNAGIAAAQGCYILPLDADDRIGPSYIGEAVNALDTDEQLGIVYCYGEKFGAETGPIAAPSYSLGRMRFSNLIFCSALFRKSDWQKVGGYWSGMVHGCEDWEFWMSLLELGRTAERLPLTGFYYRIRNNSMNARMDRDRRLAMHRLIVQRHPHVFPAWFDLFLPIYYRLVTCMPYRLLKQNSYWRKALS